MQPMPSRSFTRVVVATTLSAILALATGCVSTPRRAPSVLKQHDAATFFNTTSYTGASFSPDGAKILMSSDETGVFNVYTMPAEGGKATPLTRSTDNACFAIAYFPNDERFLYTSDQGGNELNHLYVKTPNGEVKDLTPGERVKASFLDFSKDGKALFVSTNERDPRFFDLYKYDAESYDRELIFTNNDGWNVGPVSRDGQWLILTRTNNNADSDLFLWNLLTPSAEPLHITAHKGDVQYAPLAITPDGTKLYYSTDNAGEFRQAWSYSFSTGDHQTVIQAKWDVMYAAFSENGRYRVSAINNDGRTDVTIRDMDKKRDIRLSGLPEGDLSGVTFSKNEKQMAFYLSSDTSPPNLYAFNLEENGKPEQLTDSLNPAIKPAELVEGEVVRYKSYDGLAIPAILYRPWNSSKENPAPALVWVHGGPGGQSRIGYSPIIQHLVNHGYAVLAVNNRGSSGYGKTFFHLDDKKHGDVDLKDCIWARKYLESLNWVNGKKIGIIGGSYGGYMVTAALAFEPQAFEVGIDIFGVTNWVRTLQSVPPWWAAFREGLYAELGDPAMDEARLRAISPLFHAKKITKPLLVIQGANDPRVLQVESDEIVQAVRSNGVPVEYIIFPDEGHGFRKRENRITASDAFVEFLNKYLKG